MIERFTANAIQILIMAHKVSNKLGHHQVGSEHFLIALISPQNSQVAQLLQKQGINLIDIQVEVERMKGKGPKTKGYQMNFTACAKHIFDNALEESTAHHHSWIGPEHLLLGLLEESESTAVRILNLKGLNLQELRSALRAANQQILEQNEEVEQS